jgi:hypothetical protein
VTDGIARTHAATRPSAVLLGIAAASALLVAPVGARAASRSQPATRGRQLAARTARSDASSVCSKISPSAVSAIVGYAVPAATGAVTDLKATKANDGISAVLTTCSFGAQTSLAALKRNVTLDLEVTSRPITTREVQQELAKTASASLKISVSPYPGLGVPGVYFTEVGGGISAEGISGFVGTKVFGASVFEALSRSKLASLAKLAARL